MNVVIPQFIVLAFFTPTLYFDISKGCFDGLKVLLPLLVVSTLLEAIGRRRENALLWGASSFLFLVLGIHLFLSAISCSITLLSRTVEFARVVPMLFLAFLLIILSGASVVVLATLQDISTKHVLELARFEKGYEELAKVIGAKLVKKVDERSEIPVVLSKLKGIQVEMKLVDERGGVVLRKNVNLSHFYLMYSPLLAVFILAIIGVWMSSVYIRERFEEERRKVESRREEERKKAEKEREEFMKLMGARLKSYRDTLKGLREFVEEFDVGEPREHERGENISRFISKLKSAGGVLEEIALKLSGMGEEVRSIIGRVRKDITKVEINLEKCGEMEHGPLPSSSDAREKIMFLNEKIHSLEKVCGEMLKDDVKIYENISALSLRLSEVNEILRDVEYVIEDTDFISVRILQMAVRAGTLRKAFTAIAQDVEDLADRVHAETHGIFTALSDISKRRSEMEKMLWHIRAVPSSFKSFFSKLRQVTDRLLNNITEVRREIDSVKMSVGETIGWEQVKRFTDIISEITEVYDEIERKAHKLEEVIDELEKLSIILREVAETISRDIMRLSETMWMRVSRTVSPSTYITSGMVERMKDVLEKAEWVLKRLEEKMGGE